MPMALQPAALLIAARTGWAGLRRSTLSWRQREPGAPAMPGDSAPLEAAPAVAVDARAGWSERLWGSGFTLPGGEAEALRLAHLLPLSPATTLLLVGRDRGGVAACLAERRGAWIATHTHQKAVATAMAPLLARHGRRVEVQPWTPATPSFRPRYHHHALALEPLQSGAAPGPFCRALAEGLRPGAQLVLVEVVAIGAGAPGLERWLRLDGRAAPPPSRAVVETALAEAGFTLHVTESLGMRQADAATRAWLRLLAGLREGGRPPTAAEAGALVAEAEAWLLHHRLLSQGAIAVLRWHASLPG